ncbi:helicase RepA family protein [Sphingomonas sp. IC-56]|uniref:AAA family ATPase n=1 Tax=Sphingomonas sp. IC-56 TaxID=2898529 RepID=UPI001E3DBED2|nr:AAA family ATPase [Sphingomonas sp. IC-56]MCD2324984.1 helicase RepA family protein [Sphingomonas sp. IC-56]
MTAAPFRERVANANIVPGPKPVVAEIHATPFVWRDPRAIPVRPWVYGRWLLRGTVTAVVAPGGVGKSSFMASTVLALATGRSLLGKQVWGGPQRAWYWNLEDDGDELARQIQAAAIHHRIDQMDCGDRLFIDSALEGNELCVAIEGAEGGAIQRPVIHALEAELRNQAVDVLIVDPFVSSHRVSENDNGLIDDVVKEWAKLAKRSGCSIVLVHHSKKLNGVKVTAEASRGASSLVAAARSTLVLNRMDEAEATKFGIENDDERRRLFTVQDDKHNRAPAEKATWFRMASQDLGNGEGAHGDNIGVVTCWSPPDAFDGISADHLLRAQRAISAGSYRENQQATDWVGQPVGDVLGIDADSKPGKARLRQIIRTWIDNGALIVVDGKDERRKPVKFVQVGEWADQ